MQDETTIEIENVNCYECGEPLGVGDPRRLYRHQDANECSLDMPEHVSPADFETLLELGFAEPDPARQAEALERWKAELRERVE